MNDTYPRFGFVKCDACGGDAPCDTMEDYPDGGWHLPYPLFGYYCGFTDDIDGIQLSWIICHDCVARLLALFPLLAKSLGKGGHPAGVSTPDTTANEHSKPCCDFCWATHSETKDLLLTDDNGEWRTQEQQNKGDR